MGLSKIFSQEQIEINFVKSKQAKSIRITLKPFSPVKVTMPYFVSVVKAQKFVNQKYDWIKKQSLKIKEVETKVTIFNFNDNFQTRQHNLEIKQLEIAKPKVTLLDKKILIKLPKIADLKSNQIQTVIREGIESAWRKEAQNYLPEKVANLAKKHNFQYKSITIKNTKTRWGSCSFENKINLSLHLMRLPDYLINYVILHELVHTKIKNHNRDFWLFLTRVCDGALALDKEMKNYSLKYY